MSDTKVIFLDIDGVLWTVKTAITVDKDSDIRSIDALDPVLCRLLSLLKEVDTGLRLVISSTWRKRCTKEWLVNHFAGYGLTIPFHEDWRTIIVGNGHRGDEIREWLDRHPEVMTYVCIDDDSDFHPDQPLVKTHVYDGLSFQNWRDIQKILFGDEHAWNKCAH